MVIICTTCFSIQTLCVLPTQFIYVFRLIQAVNCHYFPKQHQPIVVCKGDAVFSLWCAIWFFTSYLSQRLGSGGQSPVCTAEVRLHPRPVGVPLKCTKWHCAQFRQRSLLLSRTEAAHRAWALSVTDIREQWTEMYVRRMDFTGFIRWPCPVLRPVTMQFCATGWSVSEFPSWALVLPAMPLPHTL